MSHSIRLLKVFLCHASQDKPSVRELAQRLSTEGWIDPWLDEKKLLPGQEWRLKIEEAVETSDIVIIFLSSNSVSKEGFIQKELRYAREISLEKPEESIFLNPLRIDECDVPRGLRYYQWADYFGEKKDETYNALLESLRLRYEQKLNFEVRTIITPNKTGAKTSNKVGVPPEKPEVMLYIESKCMFSTDEYARSFPQGGNLYQKRGMLRLTSISLAFSSEGFSLYIPLKNIVSIEMKQFPRITKPITMYYLAIKHLSNFGEYTIGFWADQGTTIWSSNKGTKEWMKITERIPELASKII